MRISILFVLLLFSVDLSISRIRQIPLPDNLLECNSRLKDVNPYSFIGSLYSWLCENAIVDASGLNASRGAYNISLEEFYTKIFDDHSTRQPRQAANKCVRKEYRMLTLEERKRYHDAINILKKDTSIAPNKYDAIARIQESTPKTIYEGPGFLGWNRIYLYLYENALRQVDPRICLPYWDSTLESELNNPLESSIWSAEYFGTARGPVRKGPFANWRLPVGTELIRNVGVDGDLLNNQIIDDILSRRRYEEITSIQESGRQYSILSNYGSTHMYVGGMMASFRMSTYDPIFFMHHAFIDYIFERFRARLRSLGVDPTVYPKWRNSTLHGPNAPINIFNYTVKDGYSELFASYAEYEPVPSCTISSLSCGPGSLVCNVKTGHCIPTIRQRTTSKRDTLESFDNVGVFKPKLPYAQSTLIDYCCDESCDVSNWIMIPVRVVKTRSPTQRKYSSYPARGGLVNGCLDIYSLKNVQTLMTYITDWKSNRSRFDRCERQASVSQIVLYSHGLNYHGYFKNSSIVTLKHSNSVSLGYIGVKKPSDVKGGESRALVRAHDACGRMCHVACLDKARGEYRLCSGAIAVNNERPLMYGRQLNDAILRKFNFIGDKNVTHFKKDNLFLTFYCD